MSRAKRIPSVHAAPDFRRRSRQREPYDRVLIVCEGTTEKIYFDGLVFSLRLSSANILISSGRDGTDPARGRRDFQIAIKLIANYRVSMLAYGKFSSLMAEMTHS